MIIHQRTQTSPTAPIFTPDLVITALYQLIRTSGSLSASETTFRWEFSTLPDVPCSFPTFGQTFQLTGSLASLRDGTASPAYLRRRVMCKTLSSWVMHYVVSLSRLWPHGVPSRSYSFIRHYYRISLPMTPGPGNRGITPLPLLQHSANIVG
jgi:hypothetical protein